MRSPFCRAGLILSASLVTGLAFGQPAGEPRLRGIVHWDGENRALIEIAGRSGRPILTILRPGERLTSWGVVAIDEAGGSATILQLRPRQTNELRLAGTSGKRMPGRTFALEGARLSQVLEIYQEISGRTVIAPPRLPELAFSFESGPRLSVTEATELLDQKLAAKGIFPVPRGDKFVFITPQQRLQSLDALRDPPPPDKRGEAEVLPAGLIRFRESDHLQVLAVYSELSGRTILRPGLLPGKTVTVRSQTPLTRPEVVWLLETLLQLADVAVVPEGEKFAFAVPTTWTGSLPHFKAGNAKPRTAASAGSASARFVDADGKQFLETYASLIGRSPLPAGPEVPAAKFNLELKTPLSRAEAIFALEALAALNGLRFELVGDRQVKLAVGQPEIP